MQNDWRGREKREKDELKEEKEVKMRGRNKNDGRERRR